VGQAGESKAAVGEPHLLGVIGEHLVSSFYHHALVFGHRLSAGFFNAVLHDELMNLGHKMHRCRSAARVATLESIRAGY
jgi:hypothetical protein